MREYAFELALSARLERADRIVARQLDAAVHGRRIVDIAVVEPGPGFDDRAAISHRTIPPRAIESDVGPGRAVPVSDVFDCHPQTAAELIDAAVDAGYFERTRLDGQPGVRATVRYPDDWFETLVGVECKPDLAQPGALATQLLTDVRLGLLDKVVLATASHVTGAHLNRLPDAVGVWMFDPASGERSVIRKPMPLDPELPGVEVMDRLPARTDIRIASADALHRQRRRLAERAYGSGWRPMDPPGCARANPDADGVIHCAWKDRVVHPGAECGSACQGHTPADPPDVDIPGRRAECSAWVRDPPGRCRTQARLDRY